jgi:hypothetical protein
MPEPGYKADVSHLWIHQIGPDQKGFSVSMSVKSCLPFRQNRQVLARYSVSEPYTTGSHQNSRQSCGRSNFNSWTKMENCP